MKIIDFLSHGHVVELFLGASDLEEWWGDDWNDAPYEHNAGEVYTRYVSGITQIAIPVEVSVYEPYEFGDWYANSPYSKEDMLKRKIPCLKFEYQSRVVEVFFGDTLKDTLEKLKPLGCVKLSSPIKED